MIILRHFHTSLRFLYYYILYIRKAATYHRRLLIDYKLTIIFI